MANPRYRSAVLGLAELTERRRQRPAQTAGGRRSEVRHDPIAGLTGLLERENDADVVASFAVVGQRHGP
jgi:hypothetical protein